MQWIIDNIADQSILNTAAWRYIVPQLYKQYPDDDMNLNISVTSHPIIKVSATGIYVTTPLDVTIDVLEPGAVVPVACISSVCLIEMISTVAAIFCALFFTLTYHASFLIFYSNYLLTLFFLYLFKSLFGIDRMNITIFFVTQPAD